MSHNYFEDQINTGKPIVPPSQSISPATETPRGETQPSQSESAFKGTPVRAGGDKIFLLKGGRRYWITSAEVYEKLGFTFGDEVAVDQETLQALPEGEPIR